MMEIDHPIWLAFGLLASVGVLVALARRRPGQGLVRRLPFAAALVAAVVAPAGLVRTTPGEGAHRIYVLDQGRIVESGSHDELLAAEGRYRQLYQSQFSPGLRSSP